jgi:hypothetical protein
MEMLGKVLVMRHSVTFETFEPARPDELPSMQHAAPQPHHGVHTR